MNSVYGSVAQACHHFGWTLDYVLWGIDWRVLGRMLIDFPSVDYSEMDKEKEGTRTKKYKLTPETDDELVAQLKSMSNK